MPTIHHHLGTDHYWKPGLCQVQTALPIVKNRTLGKDLRCRVPHSAKNCTRQRILCRVPGTRQKRALGKGLLCRVPGSRQKHGTRHRLPHVTVFGHILLCRVPAVRHSAKKIFTTRNRDFAECKIICRVSKIGHSAKTFFVECQALGKSAALGIGCPA